MLGKFAASLSVLLSQGAAAQSAGQVDREAQRILEQQQQQARERAEQFDKSRTRPPSGEDAQAPIAAGLRGSGCVVVREVRLSGGNHYPADSFADVVAPLRGDCVGTDAIDAALRAITDRYVRDGFVTTRAMVGPQDLKSGVLTITVIEGRIGGIEGAGSGKHYGAGEIAAAFPNRAGDRLNLRALEQGVDQLARMAKGDPKIDIAPGTAPGTSTVLIARQPLSRWLRPAVLINNEGAASTGRWQASASLDADSLLGIADSWSFYYQGNPSKGRERRNSAYGGFASLPRGWWTLSLSTGYSAYHSVLSGNGLRFATRGRTATGSATLDRMMFRDARNKLALSAGLSLLDTRNFIQGIALRTSSYRIVSGLAGVRWQRRLGKTQLSLSGGYDQGLGLLGAHTVDTGPGGATGRYHRITFDAATQTPLAIGRSRLINALVLRGQAAFDNVFPANRLSLGGSSTVRGFRDDGISGRTGVALREQLGFGIVDLARAQPELATSLSGYLAYDAGAIRPVRDDHFERGLLQSGSAGLMMRSRHVQAEVAAAIPVTAPAWVRHPKALFSTSIRILL
ncbi:ShlB/FhaC/HecB family hemolysin secretion/activation protein [Sphingomonas endophytica]|uniref:ShlB/FhaC/HecB family hemolysin secretion/activation protein n=1 Tax=Sphingomonas endophytica TaxID=869719 RepID=UPI00160A7A70|nr:ShlB/FhaC/HecB family hemolysin secretion/activation protein [Sphingomonas endophytica]